MCYIHKDFKRTYLPQVRQLILHVVLLVVVKTSGGMLKVSTLSNSIASFTITTLARVISGSNLGQKEVLLFLVMEKTRSSSALE